MKITFAQIATKVRREKKLSQKDLGRLLGLTRRPIAMYEHGKCTPRKQRVINWYLQEFAKENTDSN